MIKKPRRKNNLINKEQRQLLARQKLTQQAQQARQQKKITFAQLESLIKLARQAKNQRATQK
jgi:protein subunit release factor B